MESKFLEGLNERQTEAVTCTEGPLLILAGAGSGKTKVLTHRVGYLIEQGMAPWHILAITFTNKAAGEMKERIGRILSDESGGGVFISTFHSMCVRLLRRDIDRLGYGRDFVIYDADDQRTLVRNIIKKINLDNKIYRERGVASVISGSKNRMIGPKEFEDAAEDFYDSNVARIYNEYENELKLNNALDFDDLLIKTVELFNSCPDVLGYWQERFRYIMVDEYQDTNNVQFEIVRLLADRYKNLCVVGDDDQSIYKFRGANIENILSFEHSFPGARVVKLEQNYRSTKSILNAANEVIKNNSERKDKSLWTKNERGPLPVYTEYETASHEAAGIIREAVSRHAGGVSLGSQAILYRTNAQSRLFEERCVTLGVPYIIVGGVNFYQRKEIKDILSYLRVIANSKDDLSLRRVINTPKRGIGNVTVERILAHAEKNGISAYEAALNADIPGLSGGTLAKIKGFTGYIEELKARLSAGALGVDDIVRNILSDGGYEDELKKDDPVEAETRLDNIEELIAKAVSYQDEHEDLDGMALLSGFLEDVALIADIDRSDIGSDALTLMTLHAAKGLEFDEVYLCGMEEGLFPSAASIGAFDPEAEIEEERRLCYVGITRARKRLHLSSADERLRMGEYMSMKPSRFIEEIPDDCLEKHYRKKHSPGALRSGCVFGESACKSLRGPEVEPAWQRHNEGSTGCFGSLDTSKAGIRKGAGLKATAFTKTEPQYGPGDRVSHARFGTGTVVSVTDGGKDYKVTVEFDDAGVKTMFAGFANMHKV